LYHERAELLFAARVAILGATKESLRMKLTELVDRIVADGRLTRAERAELEDAVCHDPDLSEEERQQVQRVRDMIDRGDLELVDG
jgi:polyhydroxyalkanoate synthesis regulator phasin